MNNKAQLRGAVFIVGIPILLLTYVFIFEIGGMSNTIGGMPNPYGKNIGYFLMVLTFIFVGLPLISWINQAINSTKCLNCDKGLGFSNKINLINSDFGIQSQVYACSNDCKNKILSNAHKKFTEHMNHAKKTSKEYICKKCEYKWISKKTIGTPAICPRCKEDRIMRYAETKEWEEQYLSNKEKLIAVILLSKRLT
ncbi:MAG: hypothetical protein WC595_02100 [Candidatus Nanoarchaeia archaeon]